MAGFRLKMAARLGEKIASDFGFESFPVCPKKIAESRDISVEAKPPEVSGVSGAIILAGDSAMIIYSTELQNDGFENFSIAHELGHWFLPGHPEEIAKAGGMHLSRASFTQNTSIELEADHFASGLLMPSRLTRNFLGESQIGLDGIVQLAGVARTSLTAAAIRSAECCPYPVAIIVSKGQEIAYAFLSDTFKSLGRLSFLRKGDPLPASATSRFNATPENVRLGRRSTERTDLSIWFDGPRYIELDEEVIGLGGYGYTLTVLSSEELPEDPSEADDEDAQLEESWTPRFAYGR